MKDFIEMTIRLPKEMAAAVRNLQAWISAMEIVSEKPCVKTVKKKPTIKEECTTPPENEIDSSEATKNYLFIERCKEVASKIGELNGKTLTINIKGKPITFVSQFDATACCKVLDELYENHERYIDDYLKGAQKPTGISIVLPFIGKIIGNYTFSSQQSIHKESLTEKLKEIYNSENIEGYLSYDGRKRRNDLNDLAMKVVEIALKKGHVHLNG